MPRRTRFHATRLPTQQSLYKFCSQRQRRAVPTTVGACSAYSAPLLSLPLGYRLSTFALSASWGTSSASCPLNGVALPASTPVGCCPPQRPEAPPMHAPPSTCSCCTEGASLAGGFKNQSECHASMLLTKLLAGDKKVVVVSPPSSPFS